MTHEESLQNYRRNSFLEILFWDRLRWKFYGDGAHLFDGFQSISSSHGFQTSKFVFNNVVVSSPWRVRTKYRVRLQLSLGLGIQKKNILIANWSLNFVTVTFYTLKFPFFVFYKFFLRVKPTYDIFYTSTPSLPPWGF